MKKFKIGFIICSILSWFYVVSAQEIDIYFNPNGGNVTTSGFSINDNNGTIVYGSNAYAKYSGTSTIKNINSISGKKFTVTKSGDSLVSGREWYFRNVYDGKTYYFSNSKTYKVKDVIKKLGYDANETFISMDLYANWNSHPKTGGTDVSGGSTSPTTSKPNSLKITASKTSIVVGEKTTLKATFSPSGTSESVSWTTSNKKIATVSSSGVVTGVKKGTVTITGKSKSGLKATIKISINNATTGTKHHSIIQLNMNGGKLASSHGSHISSSGDFILKNNSKNIHSFTYGSSTSKNGLADWDNKSCVNITRSGYVAVSGKEWNTKPDGSGKSYGDHKVYKATDFCDSSKKDCTVTLYVNWTKVKGTSSKSITVSPNKVSLKAGEMRRVEVTTKGVSKVKWTVKNTNIASVKNNIITGLNKGSTTITVSGDGVSATINVTVTADKEKASPSKEVDNRGKKLKKLGTVDLSNYKNNCIHVPSKNGISSAQGFTVAGRYYLAAKRNASESAATIYVISMNASRKSSKTAKPVSTITKNNYFGHANALTYNPNNGKIYVTKTTNGRYKTFDYGNVTSSSPGFSEGIISYNSGTLDPGGIAYSSYDNKFYLGSGWKLFVYDSTLTNNEMLIHKVARGTTQDIGAHNGKILVVRWNPGGPVGGSDLNTTRNAIDVYSGSTGNYLGSYIIKSAAEMESISYNPNTGKFAFYMQNVNGDDFDCIQEASMNV